MALSGLILGLCLLVSGQGQVPAANIETEVEAWAQEDMTGRTNPNVRFDLEDRRIDLVCSTGDLDPVNLQAEWIGEEYCYDLAGNKYEKGDTLRSCCGCIKYHCTPKERPNCAVWSWTAELLHRSCCVDCDGMVFPPGSVMRTTQLNDTCSSIETERCEEYTEGRAFVSRTVSPTTCCVNTSGLQPEGSQNLDPATCTGQYCRKVDRYPHAFWHVRKHVPGCDCCIYKETLVPDGWSTPINSFQNLTCCKGNLEETYLPPLTDCHIQNLTYLIDTSGSMKKSRPIWEPVALELLDQMVARQVDVLGYTLMDYVTTVHVTTTTSNNGVFYDAVNNMIITGGSTELTFTGLVAALQNAPCHNFICVFTDEVGNDTNDPVLKADILSMKAARKSEIFFMVIPNSPSTLAVMQANFADIGHVIDIKNNNNGVRDVVELMKSSEICTTNCTSTIKPPRPPAKAPSNWITILRRGQYGNPVTMFPDATFDQLVSGFGDKNMEFWMGLQKIAKATSSGVWELRVELVDFEENQYVAEYSNFKVEGGKVKYRLTVEGFKSTSNLQDSLSYHNGMGFTAVGRDNDEHKGNCAELHGGAAWWYNSCATSILLGANLNMENTGASSPETNKQTTTTGSHGIIWRNDKNVDEQGVAFSWPFAEMKIRKTG